MLIKQTQEFGEQWARESFRQHISNHYCARGVLYTAAKDSYLDSYLSYLDSYLDSTTYLRAI